MVKSIQAKNNYAFRLSPKGILSKDDNIIA